MAPIHKSKHKRLPSRGKVCPTFKVYKPGSLVCLLPVMRPLLSDFILDVFASSHRHPALVVSVIVLLSIEKEGGGRERAIREEGK